jgi:hypothetical protein
VDARQKARHAQRLLEDPILNEILEEAHHELSQVVIYGETVAERETARHRYLGLDEIVSRLRYLTSELEMDEEEEE